MASSTQSPQTNSPPSALGYSHPLHVIPDDNAIDVSSSASFSIDNGISASVSSHPDSPVAFIPATQGSDFATSSHGSEAEHGLLHRVAMESVHHESSLPSILSTQEAVPEEDSDAFVPPENVATTEVADSQHEVHKEEPTAIVLGGNIHHMVTRSKPVQASQRRSHHLHGRFRSSWSTLIVKLPLVSQAS
ncbi:hypothetical protein V6N12_023601 [Hibiscus sabdariffa]|uniref:Uncharacterized protein n=1 Tax=Hibiscus sabdariffa TaxID=183260 RepID=A0ABR2FZ27_9ROSI